MVINNAYKSFNLLEKFSFTADEVIAAIDPKKVEIFQRYVNYIDHSTAFS